MKNLKIKCIDDTSLYEKNLTMFKIYDVIEELKYQYSIIDDTGRQNVYCKTLFEVVPNEDD